jgi:hypothetical protein
MKLTEVSVTAFVLQKKTKGTKCSDNLTFSIVTDTAKIVAGILRRRKERN